MTELQTPTKRMSHNLRNTELILQKRKDTVIGYIRKLKSLDIPSEVVNICIAFYGNGKDIFDPECISKYMTLTENGTIVSINDNFVTASAYLSVVVDSGIHKWKFKILAKPYGMIGIYKVKNINDKPLTNIAFTHNGAGYGYCITDKTLSNPITGSTAGRNSGYGPGYTSGYGPDIIKSGQIIQMILNLNDLSLQFIINGMKYPKAFDIERCKYRAAVYGYCANTKFQIVDFE